MDKTTIYSFAAKSFWDGRLAFGDERINRGGRAIRRPGRLGTRDFGAATGTPDSSGRPPHSLSHCRINPAFRADAASLPGDGVNCDTTCNLRFPFAPFRG